MCVNTVHVCACITKINIKVRVKLQVGYSTILDNHVSCENILHRNFPNCYVQVYGGHVLE